MSAVVVEEFPVHGLLPKRETQVESFLRKFPDYDGKNTIIAIFDSGVDPGAPGLSTTPSGVRKIVNVIDCSGCGDVDTSTVLTANADGTLHGLTGRKLKIPEDWSNPTGQFHVGTKKLYSLFPTTPLTRIKKEVKEDNWDPLHRIAIAEASRNLFDYENKQGTGEKSETETLVHENYKATIDVLKRIDEKYDDCGPVYDCVVFHDGNNWRVCIDTTEEGRLDDCKLLCSFKINGDYERFSDKDMVNYAVDVMENGNLLSIITNSSSHGTHVASISAAYFPEKPEQNGIAPGAQIISMQIGDNRVGGMETGTALMRAMICAIENNVDVINLSYGEASKWANSGRVIDMMNKLVTEHNIIFVSSAGNNGPALTTVGAPGGTSEHVIGVGAYVSTDMMTAEYSLMEKNPGNQYTWSSVGPSLDGALGVCITAPGGAITSVPNWTLSKSQLMNGTSMSSPNACGGIAVLLSALKKEIIQYTPRSVRRCLENTALKIDGLSNLVQGYGLLQVDKAFEYMRELRQNKIAKFISYSISCENKRGIYIREYEDHNTPDKCMVTVTPTFHKQTENDLKITFELQLSLVSTQSWVTCPSHLDLCNGARSIPVIVQKIGLSPGVHYAEVHGYDPDQVNLGPVFRIPITVVIPENIDRKNFNRAFQEKLSFKVGSRLRKFYFVPHGATWAELEIHSKEKERDIRYVVHAVQLGSEQAFIENQFDRYVSIKAKSEVTKHQFAVKSGCTLELCIARWWAVSGDSELSTELTFHGLLPDTRNVYLNGNNAFTRIDVSNHLGMEKIRPVASLTHHVMPIAPNSNLIKPLGRRDLLPEGEQIYSLEMTYNFNLTKASDVIPVVPQLFDLLYESKYESQFWMCYNNNKYLYRSGDAFPLKYNYICKLEKGDHVLRLQIRHSDFSSLDGLKDMPVNLHIKLATAINLDVYAKRRDALDKKKKFGSRTLTCDSQCPVYITAPAEDKLPKGIKPGHQLVGTIEYAKNVTRRYPLCMSVAQPKASSDNKNKDKKEERQIEDQYKEAMEEFLSQWIGKVQGSIIEKDLTEQIGDSLSAKNTLLNALDGAKNRTSNLHKIIQTAKKIVDQVDQTKLLSYFAVKTHVDSNDQRKKEEMEKEKSAFINAVYKMGLAIADGILASRKKENAATEDTQIEEASEYPEEDLDQCYRVLAKFVENTDSKMNMLTVRHGMVYKYYGKAFSALLAYFDENGPTKEYYAVLIELTESLGYPHLVQYFKRWSLLRFPAAYELF